jgi:tetratricopeptide (TPR) repeat protein
MNKQWLVSLSLVLLLGSCVEPKQAEWGFEVGVPLTGDTLEIEGFADKVLTPVSIRLVDDLLMAVDVKSPRLFSVVDLTARKLVHQFGRQGEGPGEVIGILGLHTSYDYQGFTCWDPMLRRLYFMDKDSLLWYGPACGTEVLDKAGKLTLFDRFFSHVLPLNDTFYLGMGNCGDKRFALIDLKNRREQLFGDYANAQADGAQNALNYQGEIAYNGRQKRFVYVSYYGELLEMYELEPQGQMHKIVESHSAMNERTTTPVGRDQVIQQTANKSGRYCGVVASDEYVYALFMPGTAKQGDGPDVLVYDWKGNKVVRYKLDVSTNAIAVSSDSKHLYASAYNGDEAIIMRYELKTPTMGQMRRVKRMHAKVEPPTIEAALSLLKTHRYDEALILYDKLIALDAANRNLYVERAYVKGKLHDYEGALTDYQTSLSLPGTYSGPLLALDKEAYIPVGAADIQGIRQAYVDALIERAYRERYNSMNYSSYIKGYSTYINRALDLDSLNTEAHHCLGNAHYLLKEYEAAVVEYTKKINLDPAAWDAYYARGNAFEMLGRHWEAQADFLRARALDTAVLENVRK